MPNLRQVMMGAAGVSKEDVEKMWSWGAQASGSLGDGNTTNRSSPVLVAGGFTDWKVASAGHYCSMGIRDNGTLWTWGSSNSGYLGDGQTAANKSCPVQVGSLTDWNADNVKKASMYRQSFVIKDDGNLWAWGKNSSGCIGNGNTTDLSSPVNIGSLTDWALVVAGGTSSLAIKTDGTLWTWGYNDQGGLGLGDRTNRSSPTQVGALTTWSFATMARQVLAIKTDGTLWTWGRNSKGELGVGDTANKSSPVQIGALTTWAHTATGGNFSFAIKTDGTLWSWGYAAFGQLGHGNTTNLSSPNQVGSLTDWSKVYSGPNTFSAFALKTDGTAWAWGYNTVGNLGLGDTTVRSSPVQIGTRTTWLQMSQKSGHALSIQNN